MKKEYLNDYGLLVLRIGLALLMLPHGLSKAGLLFGGGEIRFPDPLGVGASFSLGLAVVAEVIFSWLVLLGYKVRLSVIPLIVTMLVAIFVIHINDPWAKSELAVLYLLAYVVLAIAGSGRYSLDRLIEGRK
ncbi:DoxX family protein [Marinifilum breve]|uniref:DoxX family protein n=1 Tax=Marinifilum breve TaxID=2184082 RepID=A0A2V4A4G7_9BACT|nr:DoxX family protein [Marinifilum breve]PXY03153.1 DoxX family protein [Marinifilum breve]